MRTGICILAMLFLHHVQSYASGPPASIKKEARKLYGIEYSPRLMGELIAPDISNCTYEGGGIIHLDGVDHYNWAKEYVYCSGHVVILLSKKIDDSHKYGIWRVVDLLPLPKLELLKNLRNPERPVLYSSFEGLCSVQGRYGMDFIALLSWGRRERIDWKTGVRRAWTFDITQERIVPLPTRHIQCQWEEP
ncbi:hypothetical protein [Noviherbaspirillum album]|nr:hypothetical protein [Noviherbaspirillum sp. CPCC 100848]